MEVGFINIFLSLAEKLENKELERAVIVAKLIWLCRNSVVYGGNFSLPSNIKNSAMSQIKNFHKNETREEDYQRYKSRTS